MVEAARHTVGSSQRTPSLLGMSGWEPSALPGRRNMEARGGQAGGLPALRRSVGLEGDGRPEQAAGDELELQRFRRLEVDDRAVPGSRALAIGDDQGHDLVPSGWDLDAGAEDLLSATEQLLLHGVGVGALPRGEPP